MDTNVVLDVLLEREPHVADSTAVLAAIERGELLGLLGATSITTVHYLATRAVGAKRAKAHIETLIDLFQIAPVTAEVLRGAVSLGFADFEDAVLHEAAVRAGADAIVTRNAADFRRASLRIYSPIELMTHLRIR